VSPAKCGRTPLFATCGWASSAKCGRTLFQTCLPPTCLHPYRQFHRTIIIAMYVTRNNPMPSLKLSPCRLPPPPPGLDDSLKTRYFMIHGSSDPQNGPGLERFWIGPNLPVPLVSDGEVETSLLVYGPCATMPLDACQHALSVYHYASEARRLLLNTPPFEDEEPALLSPRPRVLRRPWLFPLPSVEDTPAQRLLRV
jgi:hypothetical protein